MQILRNVADPINALQRPWRLSRPGQQPQRTEDILFDAQLLEFVSGVFEFHVPVVLRDVVCGYRDHVVWAQTSRVNDPAEGFTSWGDLGAGQQAEIDAAVKRGEPQDSYRMHLPVTAYTKFSARITARRYAKMVRWVDWAAAHAEDPTAASLLSDFSDALHRAAPPDWDIGLLTEKVSAESPWPTLQDGAQEHLEYHGFMRYALLAQLLRHRNLDIFSMMQEALLRGDLLQKTLADYVYVGFKAPNVFLHDVVAKRNCWIAQGDLWQPILKELSERVGHPLPCDGGACPFVADNVSRVRGEDPNPPCPIFLRTISGGESEADKAMLRAYATDQRPDRLAFWLEEIDKA